VIAQFDLLQFSVAYPFKLNPSWMAEEEFTTIVKEVWKDTCLSGGIGYPTHICLEIKYT
jgi:hypothetical protein